MSTNLPSLLNDIRALADKAKAAALAEVKVKNAALPTGHKLPSLAIANHAKSSATVTASASLIAALQSGELVVKGAGKILKSGDASLRIGRPLASLSVVVAEANAKALKSREARMVTRFRAKFPKETEGKTDAVVLTVAKAYAERVEAEKASAKAEREKAVSFPAGKPSGEDSLAGLLQSLDAKAA